MEGSEKSALVLTDAWCCEFAQRHLLKPPSDHLSDEKASHKLCILFVINKVASESGTGSAKNVNERTETKLALMVESCYSHGEKLNAVLFKVWLHRKVHLNDTFKIDYRNK